MARYVTEQGIAAILPPTTLLDQYGNAIGTAANPLSTSFPGRKQDVTGRLQVSMTQNIYEADFEYGPQPLRWEALTAGAGTIAALPGSGGVRMRIVNVGDVTIRQSRPYHRYQPGKTMYMATAMNFGSANAGQRQRVGFFDDGNGLFLEQGDPTATNPYGMFACIRSDINGVPVDTRVSFEQWTDVNGVKGSINWLNIQMLWMEYAWYGAGLLRWGVILNGEPYALNEFASGNQLAVPWARTGNLPVRYEQRNITSGVQNDMYHYGVSVLVNGRIDPSRGFTYGYGMALSVPTRPIAASSTRFPLLSIAYRPMGTQEYTQAGAAVTAGTTTSITVAGTPWTVGQWVGRYVLFTGLGSGAGTVARITANTANTLTFQDNVLGGPIAVTPGAGQPYVIGLINRGQVLPLQLMVSSSAAATVELISSTPTSPVTLTGASFASMASLGSTQSFVNRDVSGTALSGGEVVYNAPCPPGGLQVFDLSNFFPLYNTIRGNNPDTLTVAISTGTTAANVQASLYCQEAMS